jgi:hypothetical protein
MDRLVFADLLKNVVSGYPLKLKEPLDRWQAMEHCAFGILMTYGMVERNEYVRLFRLCYPELAEEEAAIFLDRRIGLRLHSSRLLVDNQEEFIYVDLMDDPDGWYELLLPRENVKYRLYTKDEYISVLTDGYPREPAHYHELLDILMRNGLNEEDAIQVLRKSAFDFYSELHFSSGIPDVVREIEWNSEKDLKSFVNLYCQFTNDIPIWANKGHSPNEMIANKQRPAKADTPAVGKVLQFPGGSAKVGRNDPCPCGSGKKYKHCCGMLN